jgi:hypothetical protein
MIYYDAAEPWNYVQCAGYPVLLYQLAKFYSPVLVRCIFLLQHLLALEPFLQHNRMVVCLLPMPMLYILVDASMM